jgi:hypothetical protein
VNTTVKAALGVLGVTLPALFSYLSARAESTDAKVRAEVAYVTLQASVVELQKRVEEQDDTLAKQQGQLELLERWRPAGPMLAPRARAVRPAMPAPPESFMDAVEQYQHPKK